MTEGALASQPSRGFGLTANQVSRLSKRRTRTANGWAPGRRGARGEGGAGERAQGLVGKNRTEKPLSSIMPLHPSN